MTSGFTLIEVLVTVVLMGILFAIAAPNWVAFMNQQRVGAARNQISQAIRNAQSQAQQTKVNRALVFDNNNNQPRYAIVPAPDNTIPATISNWQNLGDGSVPPGTIRLTAPAPTLIFDSFGSVVTSATPPISLPYTVTIGSTLSSNPRRCVTVQTLLGVLAEGSNGTQISDGGCPVN